MRTTLPLVLALVAGPAGAAADAAGAVEAGAAGKAASAAATAPAPGPRAFAPVDEAVRDADFFAFRARLQAALARRDAAAVLAVVHPHVRNGFGGDDGAAAFRRRWKPEGRDSRLWETLAGALALGGSFMGPDGFAAPYVYSAWPQEIDPFEHVALLGPRVPVHMEPAAAAPVLATLDSAIVPLAAPLEPEAAWVAVRLPDGRWRLTALVAGD
ncbi:hypothetical protein [Azohydromonas aeria]|uniref:hypothetical protein n=1 Tax=Azohydromonas aeria TaxID=2590212 RepID=UPI0012F9F280|nr:hypothetical protein [Azohydromonas aeria]